MSTARQVMLCADDFGQSEAISRGILELITMGRLTATSVMSEGPYWPQGAQALAAVADQADIGLHLNLTHAFAADSTKRPLWYWLLFSALRIVSRQSLAQEFCRQIDSFKQHLGRLPDFIDGHQHVHAFPVIRLALTDAIHARWGATEPKPWLRAPDDLIDGGDAPHKARVLRWICSGFTRHAISHGLRVSHRFGGLYSLAPQANFPDQMRHWLHTAPHASLLMCHPGSEAVDVHDPIAAVRGLEYAYLASPAFAEDCANAGITLARFREIA